MELRLPLIEKDGSIRISLSTLYALLRRGLAKLDGPYLVLDPRAVEILSKSLSQEDLVPEAEFCPPGEPQPLDLDPDDVLAQACSDVYRYFPGDETSRCAACAVKVYATIGDQWLVTEEQLVKLLELAKEFNTPLEWSKGNIVYTTCPPDYRDAKDYPPGSYVEGLKLLRKVAEKILTILCKE